ncbi:MAG: peptide chain release factor N(5)-glutamine methyltransferase [Clostridiales bacterium]|nr:peptide chain release factor N(5)-glutamine methyltransferase [Clostridiales bacterium]
MGIMKLSEFRKSLKDKLKEFDIETTDADFILSEVLKVKRTSLVLIDEIEEKDILKCNEAIEKRLKGMPIDKIFGHSCFYGMEFHVNQNVLTPRPETEILVELALDSIKENDYKDVLDVCTGSGCIAVTIKKNADVNVTAVDISSKALDVARMNAKTHETEIEFIKSDMFQAVEKTFDLIVSNPPYIDSEDIEDLDVEVKEYDPRLALDGGEFGLKFYHIIHDNLRKFLRVGGMLIMEIGENQKELIMSIFNDFNFVDCVKDYSGLDRILIFKR